MISIVMDSANQYLVVALYKDGVCLEKIQEMGNRKQSENAIVYLEKVLKNHDISMHCVDEMILTIGPGSYTGVRVALTIAKTLNATLNMPIKVVSSLQAFAGFKNAISILDARSHKVFLGIYENGHSLIEECLIDIDELDSYIEKYPDYEITGDAMLAGKESKEAELAENIYRLSLMKDYVQDVDGLVPMYIKEVEAKKLCK